MRQFSSLHSPAGKKKQAHTQKFQSRHWRLCRKSSSRLTALVLITLICLRDSWGSFVLNEVDALLQLLGTKVIYFSRDS